VQHAVPNEREPSGGDCRQSVDFNAVLLAMAGHDLRQYLQVIVSSYGFLADRVGGDRERKHIELGQRAAARMAEQMGQLVTAVHIHQKTGRIDWVPVRLGPLFSMIDRDTVEFASQRGVEFRAVPTRAAAASDPVLLRSILGNLVQNAVKFTLPGGRVLLGCRRRGRTLRIEVRDNGIGIPSQRLQDIFEAFHRLDPGRPGGLGLGLSVVGRAVELLQHHLEVTSAVGRGSCFTIVVNTATMGRAGAARAG